jgi:outer membrane biosynthesis protein TonB
MAKNGWNEAGDLFFIDGVAYGIKLQKINSFESEAKTVQVPPELIDKPWAGATLAELAQFINPSPPPMPEPKTPKSLVKRKPKVKKKIIKRRKPCKKLKSIPSKKTKPKPKKSRSVKNSTSKSRAAQEHIITKR